MKTTERLEQVGLDPTSNRVAVLDAVLGATEAVTPAQIRLRMDRTMNKVTLYRILDKLVDAKLIEKHSGAGRAYHYCAGSGHGHFHCTRCDKMICLRLPADATDLSAFTDAAIASIESMELRLDGVCAECAQE